MEKIKRAFLYFAETEVKEKCKRYYDWCLQIVHDDELLHLIESIPATQPKPNLFFATVKYVSKKRNREFYELLISNERMEQDSFAALKQFCREHKESLLELFQTKYVQTNEVGRASYLYPLFASIYKEAKKPLTLIEIGTSAGALLHVDQFQIIIEQQPRISFGKQDSSITVNAQNLGEALTNAYQTLKIDGRYGIDLNVLNLQHKEDMAWLEALIWPGDKERYERLQQLKVLQANQQTTLMNGNFIELIPTILNSFASKETQVVIFHTHVANQFPGKLKEELLSFLNEVSLTTPIYHVYNNLYDEQIHVDYIERQITKEKRRLPKPDGHGKSFYWTEKSEA
jgi:hypothetical protein